MKLHCFGAQSNFVLPVQGKPGAFIFIADQWRPKNAIDGRYVWFPVTVSGNSFTITWHDSWDLTTLKAAHASR